MRWRIICKRFEKKRQTREGEKQKKKRGFLGVMQKKNLSRGTRTIGVGPLEERGPQGEKKR